MIYVCTYLSLNYYQNIIIKCTHNTFHPINKNNKNMHKKYTFIVFFVLFVFFAIFMGVFVMAMLFISCAKNKTKRNQC